jgi:hypothetical protein
MFMASPLNPRLLRVRNGAIAGLAIALLAIGVGLGRALLAFLSGSTVGFADLFPTIAWYVTAFVVAGGFVGLFWPGDDSAGRRRLLFIGGVAIVVGVIGVVESGPPQAWRLFDWLVWVGLSVAFGLALSFGYERY